MAEDSLMRQEHELRKTKDARKGTERKDSTDDQEKHSQGNAVTILHALGIIG